MARYFGTNGVRGKLDTLSPGLALSLSRAIGSYFKGGKMLIGRDCRLSGPVLRDSVEAGLSVVGCEITDLGVVSSPTAEFMAKKLGADGLIIITASHNPPEWNALKVVDEKGIAVSKERGEEIEKLMEKPVPGSVSGDKKSKKTKYTRASEDHIEAIMKQADSQKIIARNEGSKQKLKFILDCGNGTACMIAPQLFERLGCDVMTLNGHPDGRFPGRPSEPTEANVKDLIAAVKSGKADAGIAWDGDGDRVIFVDEKGDYVIGDKVFALCILWEMETAAKQKKQRPGSDIVTTVATSKVVEDIATRFGLKTRYTAIGAPYLCEEMVKKPALMGGEEVGGVIYPNLSMAKDGFMVAAKLAEALCEKPLSMWLKELPVYYNVKRKIEADPAKKKEMVSRVLNHAKKNKLAFVDVDGVRVNLKDSWVIVRASGTEDYVRIFAEAKSKDAAEELANEYEKIAKI